MTTALAAASATAIGLLTAPYRAQMTTAAPLTVLLAAGRLDPLLLGPSLIAALAQR